MRKFGIAIFTLGAIASANAAVNFNINGAYQSAVPPSSGSITLVYTGTVDILLPTYAAAGLILENPGTSSNDFLNATIDPGFEAYITSDIQGLDYSGNLFSVTVNSTSQLGNYWFNPGNGSSLAEALFFASDGITIGGDNEFFGVNVVPEPATMAVIGLGAAAMIRRRSRKS